MPTLHLTNFASRAQHGPGHLWCAMALPRQWEHGDGRVAKAAPALADLEAIKRGEISPDDYRVLCVDRFAVFAESGSYAVGKLRAVVPAAKTADARAACRAVGDGDTLFCACPRPDRPRRYPFCHLELLAPFLAAAGYLMGSEGQPAPIRVKTSTRGSSGGLLQLRQWCKLVQIGADRCR